MSPSGAEYLRHILDEATFISSAVATITREAFLADQTVKRAVVRSLEIIGEAAAGARRNPDRPSPDLQKDSTRRMSLAQSLVE